MKNRAVQLSNPSPQSIDFLWNFTPSKVPLWRKRQVAEAVLRRSSKAPRHAALKPVQASASWVLYFIYAPDGFLNSGHRYTLSRFKDSGQKILAVCASRELAHVSPELLALADAVYWKELGGYDFSAYRVGLAALARHSPGARVFVLNDSVFGPFSDTAPLADAANWALTGLTANSKIENHIQSYAFLLREVTSKTLRALWGVMFPGLSLNDRDDVIFCQETRLARVAAKRMSVGSVWFSKHETSQDLTQTMPLELLRCGFPFLKRSLLLSRSSFADKDAILAALEDNRHPLPAENTLRTA